jgi:SAM-dependent methyltransferase
MCDGIGDGHRMLEAQCTVRPIVEAPAACPACGGPIVAWLAVPASDPVLGDQGFELARCRRCGSAVTLGELPGGLYESGAYRPGTPRLREAAGALLGLFDHQRLGLVRALAPPPARLLDAGAGRGRFVAVARAAGYDAFGIEPSQRDAGAPAYVERASIEDARIAPESVDVVSLWHVLEHLEAPAPALERIGSWLRPGGGVLVGVPNLASLQAEIGRERWFHLDVPRHRVHYTPAGLATLLHSHGFDVIEIRHTLLEHNPFGMWQTLVNLMTRQPSYLYNLLKRNAPLRSPDLAVTAAALSLTPVAGALELAAGAARRGGTIAALARSRREG